MTDRPYPRRTLAAVTGLTIVGAGLLPTVMPRLLVPASVWELAYIAGGLTLIACAIWPDTPLNVRAVGATVLSVGLGASVVETLLELAVGDRPVPRVLLSAAVVGLVGAHSLALLAYWHRLDRIR